jgi:hypothetical protein
MGTLKRGMTFGSKDDNSERRVQRLDGIWSAALLARNKTFEDKQKQQIGEKEKHSEKHNKRKALFLTPEHSDSTVNKEYGRVGI